MHIHKISNQKHIHFLKEERKDPITGDLIVEGDEVVFCAECKSAFLKESWEYIGKRHCESSRTIYIFPQTKTIRISKILPFNEFYFVVSDSVPKSQKKLKIDFGNHWQNEEHAMTIPKISHIVKKKVKISLKNFDLDKSPALNITLIISFIICLLVLFTADLTSKEQNIVSVTTILILAYPFVLTYFYPNTFFDIERSTEQELIYCPILFFEKDKLCLYFEKEKQRRSVDYKNISNIILYYAGGKSIFHKIELIMSNGNVVYFKLANYEINKNSFLKKVESIIKIVSKSSPTTLISFKTAQNHPMFYSLKKIEKRNQNVWIGE